MRIHAAHRDAGAIRTCRVECVRRSTGQDHFGGTGVIEADEQVTFAQLPCDRHPATGHRCQICHRTAAYRPGSLSEALTGHYRRAYPEALSLPAQ